MKKLAPERNSAWFLAGGGRGGGGGHRDGSGGGGDMGGHMAGVMRGRAGRGGVMHGQSGDVRS